jgi:catechol 2,3-dioxygenase-like lactoylglutathione lyase family enzyme
MKSIPTTEVSMSMIDQEIVLAHFIVSDDVERSRRFYTDVLGGRTVISGEANDDVTYVTLANSWIIINVGGGPIDDKPTVTLETPPDPRSGEQLPRYPGCGHPSRVRGVERAGRPIPHAAQAARDRDPLLHP